MRRVTGAALATVVALVLCSPAVAARTGTITGRVVNKSSGRPQSGVRVRLQSGSADGERVSRSTTTDKEGRYSFDGLAIGDDYVYVVDAFFDGGMFPGRALQLPSDTTSAPVIETTTKVWPTTTDPTVIGLPRDDLFAISSDDGLGVIESVTVLNSSDFAYIGRGGDESAPGRSPSLGFALPEGAQGVQIQEGTTLDIPKLVASDFGFAATVAIPPGLNRVTFSYSMPDAGAQFELSRNALYPTGEISVYTRPPLTASGNRLVESGEKSIEGTTYNLWTTEDDQIDPGDPVQILLVADAGKSATLLAGIGVLGLALLVGIAVALRRRARRMKSPPRARPTRPSRERLLTEIAALDIAFEAGDLSRDEWERRRRGLKRELADMAPVS